MQSQQLIGGNFCLAKAGLTGLSGAATTFTTAAAVLYSIAGKALNKVAVAGGATPTTDAVTGLPITIKPGQGTVVLWCLDAAGNIKAVQGSVEIVGQDGNFQFAPPQMPTVPDTLTVFGYSVHKGNPANAATPLAAAWTFGVSNWNVAGTVHTASDLIAIPNRPQAA